MKITWYGHSCFLVETEDGSVVLDPYAPGSVPGFTLPSLRADSVVCSHGHDDHGFSEGISLSRNGCGIDIHTVKSFHDDKDGQLRGNNDITVLESEGLKVVHLGDLGHELNDRQLSELGKVDVLMIPVGGHYTIDAKMAREVCRSLSPSVIIPMHYRCGKRGYPVLGEVSLFLELFEPSVIRFLDGSSTVLKAPLENCVLVFNDSAVLG